MSTPELDYITVQGFKSIASMEKLALGPINVIIGPNGSGKSNFVNVFSFLQAVLAGRLTDFVRRAGGSEALLYFGSKTTEQIRLQLSFCKEGVIYGIELKPAADDSLFRGDETITVRDGFDLEVHGQLQLPFTADPWDAAFGPKQQWIKRQLGRWRLYHVHDTSATSPLRKTAKLNDNRFLRPDGSNLPAFLYLLSKKYSNEYRLIRRTIQQVAPFFDDFLLDPDPLNEESIRLAWRHKNSDQYFGASSLSDGTLRFIALAALFLQPDDFRPSVILVDEPELGLHPQAITLLASLVKQASQKTQVILSTQSSLLLDHFQPEDVLVADRVEGSTQFTRLESEKLASWLEDYSLGQLWEKNELDGRPGRE